MPDACEIEVDRRLTGFEPDHASPGDVEAFVRKAIGDCDGIEFLPPFTRMPALIPRHNDPDLPPIRDAIRRVVGREPAVLGVAYGTDAGPLGECGLPGFVIGPGNIEQAHTKDEWVELDQVRLAAEVYFEIAREFGRT